jgi:hypothetical protein
MFNSTGAAADPTVAYGDSRKIGTTATFTCPSGYHTSDATVLGCTSGGTWNGTKPVCTRISNYCPPLSAPTNGSIAGTSSFQLDDVATFSVCNLVMNKLFIHSIHSFILTPLQCSSGYELSNVVSLQCIVFNATNGQWNGTAPTCPLIVNYCTTDPTVINGQVTISNHSLGGVATLTCDKGYQVSGEKKTLIFFFFLIVFNLFSIYQLSSGSANATCGVSTPTVGVWGALGTCSLIVNYCPTNLSSPDNGNAPTYSDSGKLGSTVSFTCSFGYELPGAV